MYIVFIAGSIPTLCPFFKKYFSKSIKSDHYHNQNRPNTPLHGGDRTILTSASVPPAHLKTYKSTRGRQTRNQIYEDDSGGYGDRESTEDGYSWIPMTGNVKIGEEFVGIAE